MGVDNAVVCLSVVLSTPMNVIWRCEPPLQPCFKSNVELPRNKKHESADCPAEPLLPICLTLWIEHRLDGPHVKRRCGQDERLLERETNRDTTTLESPLESTVCCESEFGVGRTGSTSPRSKSSMDSQSDRRGHATTLSSSSSSSSAAVSPSV